MGINILWERMSQNILIAINILLLGIQIYLFKLLRELIKKDMEMKENQSTIDIKQKNASMVISEKYLIKLEDDLPERVESTGEEAKKSMEKEEAVEDENKEIKKKKTTKEEKTKKRKRKKLF